MMPIDTRKRRPGRPPSMGLAGALLTPRGTGRSTDACDLFNQMGPGLS